MGRRESLTEKEKGKIDQLMKPKFSQRNIALELGRSRAVVQNYLNAPEKYGTAIRAGRPKAVSPRTLKKVRRVMCNAIITAQQVRAQLNLPVTKRTVQRYASSSKELKWQKLKTSPALTAMHKRKRVLFALAHISWVTEWNQVVFSDEKKFNLDGSDGFGYY